MKDKVACKQWCSGDHYELEGKEYHDITEAYRKHEFMGHSYICVDDDDIRIFGLVNPLPTNPERDLQNIQEVETVLAAIKKTIIDEGQ